MPLVQQIVFYQKYNAETTYLEPLYEKLLTRRESLTEKEGEALGLKSSLRISAARQELLRFMLPEADRTQPLPLKMKDTVLRVIQRLLGSSSASSQSSSHVNGKSWRRLMIYCPHLTQRMKISCKVDVTMILSLIFCYLLHCYKIWKLQVHGNRVYKNELYVQVRRPHINFGHLWLFDYSSWGCLLCFSWVSHTNTVVFFCYPVLWRSPANFKKQPNL